jgi:hypothetical protein
LPDRRQLPTMELGMSKVEKETPERLRTIQEAAALLGLPVWKLRRAVKRGLVVSYRLANTRALVRLSEVVAVIEASRTGGAR